MDLECRTFEVGEYVVTRIRSFSVNKWLIFILHVIFDMSHFVVDSDKIFFADLGTLFYTGKEIDVGNNLLQKMFPKKFYRLYFPYFS